MLEVEFNREEKETLRSGGKSTYAHTPSPRISSRIFLSSKLPLGRTCSETLFQNQEAELITSKPHRRVYRHKTPAGECIYTKIFIRKSPLLGIGQIFALLRAHREQFVAQRLHEAGLSVATPLGWGTARLQDGLRVAISQTEEVLDAESLSRILRETRESSPERRELLELYGAELAAIHHQGFLPADYHVSNILVVKNNEGVSLVHIDHESTRAWLARIPPLRRRNLILSLCRSANPELYEGDDADVLRGYQRSAKGVELSDEKLEKLSVEYSDYREKDLVKKKRRHRRQRRKRKLFARLGIEGYLKSNP